MAGPLFVYAAGVEAGRLAGEPNALALGVGKSSAAVTLTARLAVDRPSKVIAFGVAGSYVGGPEVGSVVVVRRDILLDEGVMTPEGFLSVADLGLPATSEVAADGALTAQLATALGAPVVDGATVSTCSGTDALAADCAARSRARIETMEGAAIGLCCQHFGVPWGCVRAISNRTGDRQRAGWDLDGAAAAVQTAVRTLMTVLS